MIVSVLWLFLTVLWVGLQCVIVVFPDHTHFLVGCKFAPGVVNKNMGLNMRKPVFGGLRTTKVQTSLRMGAD